MTTIATNKSAAASAYAVIGYPVKHSLSPLIHRHFAELTGESLSYDLLEAEANGFEKAASNFFSTGGAGLNITLPFKEQACDFVDRLSPAAAVAGAVNTIIHANGVCEGHNTDGIGLVRDLQANLKWRLKGARVLLIGAGGASRGALAALVAEDPSVLVVTNRTLDRAEKLIADVAPGMSQVQVQPTAELIQPFDVVINATSASLAGQGALVPTQAVRGAHCYDMLYAPTQTVFCGWAQSHGATQVADGLGMLLEQAAEAFALWRGVVPDTRDLLDKRAALFAAKQTGAFTLTEFLEAANRSLEPALEPVPEPKLEAKTAYTRFIAGAVCPKCRDIDRIVVRVTDGVREQACVACGFVQPEAPAADERVPQSLVPRGKHERAPAADSSSIPSQPVRLIDPQAVVTATEKNRLEKPLKKPLEDTD